MDTKEIIKYWKFPPSTIVNRNLPKVQIYPHMKSTKDKLFLKEVVQSIYVLATFRTDNTRIPVFDLDGELYQEIQFLYVKTKHSGKSLKLYKILAELIPYPLVILAEESESFILYTGKFQKLYSGYFSLLSVYHSPIYKNEEIEKVLEYLVISELPRENMKVFYNGIRDILATELARTQYSMDIHKITGEVKDQMDALNTQIKKLRIKIKKEQQLNRKIDMQMQLKKIKDELFSLMKNIE